MYFNKYIISYFFASLFVTISLAAPRNLQELLREIKTLAKNEKNPKITKEYTTGDVDNILDQIDIILSSADADKKRRENAIANHGVEVVRKDPTDFYKHRLIVKKKVPSGLESKPSYDKDYNSVYIPLFRVTEKGNIIVNSLADQPENRENLQDLDDVVLDRASQQNVDELVSDIKQFIKLQNKKMELKDLDRSLKKLNRITDEYNQYLRAAHDGSGEAHDPDAPGKDPDFLEHKSQEAKNNKKRFVLPEYSVWNFWTYQKTLIQDECPLNQVKHNNVCVWVPPH